MHLVLVAQPEIFAAFEEVWGMVTSRPVLMWALVVGLGIAIAGALSRFMSAPVRTALSVAAGVLGVLLLAYIVNQLA